MAISHLLKRGLVAPPSIRSAKKSVGLVSKVDILNPILKPSSLVSVILNITSLKFPISNFSKASSS